MNGDGEVGIGDVNSIISVILGYQVPAAVSRCADVNGDGEVTIGDINMVIRMILGSN